jgi:hypothetical protein
VSEHFDSEGFPALRDILPKLDYVKHALDGGRQRLISLLGLAWISGIGAGADSGNIAEIFLDGFGFNCAARNSVPSGEMDGIEPQLKIAPLDWHLFEHAVVAEP